MDDLLLFESLIRDDTQDLFDENGGADSKDDKNKNIRIDYMDGTSATPEVSTTALGTVIRRQGEVNPEFDAQKRKPSVQFDDSKQELTKDPPPVRFGQRYRSPNNRVQDEAPLLQLTQGGYQRPYQRPIRFRNRQISRPDSSEQSENIQEPDRSSNDNRPLNARRIVPQVAYSVPPQSPYTFRPGSVMRGGFDLPPRNGVPVNAIMPTAAQNGILNTPPSGFPDYTTAAFQTQFPSGNDIGFANFARTPNTIPMFQSSQPNPFQDPRLFYQSFPQVEPQPILFDPARNMQPQVPPNGFYPNFENGDDGSRSNFANYFSNPTVDPQYRIQPNLYGTNLNEAANTFNNPPISFLSNYPNPDGRFSSQFFRHPVAIDPQSQTSFNDQNPDSDTSQESKRSSEGESKEESPSNTNDSSSAPFGTRLQNEGNVFIRYPTNEAGYAIEESLPPQNISEEVKDNVQPSPQEQISFPSSDPYRDAINTLRNQRSNHTYRFVPEELFKDAPVDFGYQRPQSPIFVEYPDRSRDMPRYPAPNFDPRGPLTQVTSLPENAYPFLNAGNERHVNPILEATPSCAKENASVCFEDSEYPRNDILYSINSNSFLMDRLSSLDVLPDSVALVEQNVTGNPKIEENYACEVDTRYGAPLRAKNLGGSWRVIVNLEGRFAQPTRMEVCRSIGDPCRYTDSKIKTTCVQKYSLQRLMAWSPDRGIFSDVFKIPVACSCQILELAEA